MAEETDTKPKRVRMADWHGDEPSRKFDLQKAVKTNPLAKRPPVERTQTAWKAIIRECDKGKPVLLPGQICAFRYDDPLHKEDLSYYDAAPLVIFFGHFKTKDGKTRELGFNLHYFPLVVRKVILGKFYTFFYKDFQKNFEKGSHQAISNFNYKHLRQIMKVLKKNKCDFAVREYAAEQRKKTYLIPPRLYSTAIYTEGDFQKKTRDNIFRFWKSFLQKN